MNHFYMRISTGAYRSIVNRSSQPATAVALPAATAESPPWSPAVTLAVATRPTA